jgi:hypothetical protein
MLLLIFSYFTGNPNCPVRAFIKYFSRLNPERTDFWQRPRPAGKVEDSEEVWYENSPVGKKQPWKFDSKDKRGI